MLWGRGSPSPSNSWPFKRASSERGTKAPPAGAGLAHAPGAGAADRVSAGGRAAGAGLPCGSPGGRAGGARPVPLALHAAVGPALFFWDSALTSPTLRGGPMGCGGRPLISMRLEPSTPAALGQRAGPGGGAGLSGDRKGRVRQWEARKCPAAPPRGIVSPARGPADLRQIKRARAQLPFQSGRSGQGGRLARRALWPFRGIAHGKLGRNLGHKNNSYRVLSSYVT